VQLTRPDAERANERRVALRASGKALRGLFLMRACIPFIEKFLTQWNTISYIRRLADSRDLSKLFGDATARVIGVHVRA